MSQVCRICSRERANERFGGKGLRAVVCSECRKLPKDEQRRSLAAGEVYDFLSQSNISQKNIQRLRELELIEDEGFQELRRLVLEVALCQPRKRKRWSLIRKNHPELYQRMVASGLFGDLIVLFEMDAFGPMEIDAPRIEELESDGLEHLEEFW